MVSPLYNDLTWKDGVEGEPWVSPLYNDLTWKDGVEGETMGFPSI